jgi:hypothetical protein
MSVKEILEQPPPPPPPKGKEEKRKKKKCLEFGLGVECI